MKKLLLIFMAALSLATFAACNNSAGDHPEQTSTSAVEATNKAVDGQALFVQNCSACHQKDRDAVGPMLKGATERWGGDKARLYSFIKNSSEAIAKGDPRAVELDQKWGNKMPLFTQLTDAEIEAILEYAD